MEQAAEERVWGLAFRLPPGFALETEAEESFPSLIPGAPPVIERFRQYVDTRRGALHLFYFADGHHRDRGPMAWAETWQINVAGRPVTAGRTSYLFGRRQAVLLAHLQHPIPRQGRYLFHAKGLDRAAFDRVLTGLRFEGPVETPRPR